MFAVCGSLAVLGIWLIASGPLSLDLVAPNIRDAVNRNLTSYRVDFETANLRWFSRIGVVDVRVSNVQIFDSEDELIAGVPDMDLRFSVSSILRGNPSPSRVEMIGASAVFIRQADGQFQLGLTSPPVLSGQSRPGDQSEIPKAADFIGFLIGPIFSLPERDQAATAIEDFAIRNALLTFYDEPTDSTWQASDVLIEFTRSGYHKIGRLEAKIDVLGTPVSIWLDAKHDLTTGTTAFDVEFSDVALGSFARKFGASTIFERLTSPVSGTMSLKFSPYGTLTVGQLVILASSGEIDLNGLVLHGEDELPSESDPDWALDGPYRDQEMMSLALQSVRIDGAILEASWNPVSRRVLIDQFAIYGPENRIAFIGGIKADMQEDQPYVPAYISLDMKADDSRFFVAGILEDKLHIDDLSFSLTFDVLNRQLIVEEVSIAAYGGLAQVSGLIVEGFAENGVLAPNIKLRGKLRDMPVAAIVKFWPIFVGSGGRDWIAANVTNGVVSRGDLKVMIAEGALVGGKLPADAIQFDFSFENVDAHYIRGLTPIKNAVGNATLYSNSIVLTIPRADIGNLVATNGEVRIPRLVPKGAVAEFTVTVAGDAQELLEVIDMEPLALMSAFGLDPQNVTGDVTLTITVGRPMRRYVPVEAITYRAVAEGRNLSLANGIGNLPLTNGELSIDITDMGIEGYGTVEIAGVPADFIWHENFKATDELSTTYVVDIETDASELYKLGIDSKSFLQGVVLATIETTGNGFEFRSAKVDLNLSQTAIDFAVFGWRKERGLEANASFLIKFTSEGYRQVRDFSLLGQQVDVEGNFDLSEDFRLLNAYFPKIVIGEAMDLSLESTRTTEENRLVLNLHGNKFFGGVLLKDFIFLPRDQASAPISIDAYWDSVKLNNGVMLQDVFLNFSMKNGSLTKCDVDASFKDGGGIKVILNGVANGKRHLSITSTDGGAVVRALTENTGVIGGDIELSMELGDMKELDAAQPAELTELEISTEIVVGEFGGSELGLDQGVPQVKAATSNITYGTVKMKGFRVANLPMFARLLSTASLQGMRDILNGEGLWFDQMEVPFSLNGQKLEFTKAIAFGPSMGVTLEGYYDRGVRELNVVGALFPAYSLNKALGNVPVIGDLFVSREGEGVLGFTYRIEGEPEDARVFVNPLSTLAPGFLRRLFQVGRPEVTARPDSEVLPLVSNPKTLNVAPTPEVGDTESVSVSSELPTD